LGKLSTALSWVKRTEWIEGGINQNVNPLNEIILQTVGKVIPVGEQHRRKWITDETL